MNSAETADSTTLVEKRDGPRLTNTDAQEAPVVLQTYLAAGKKVSDGRDRLSVATGTGADRQDEITQRQTRKFSRL